MRLEELEARLCLNVTVIGTAMLDLKTPIRNAVVDVQIPILNRATPLDLKTFTSPTGGYSVTDPAATDQMAPNGTIKVTIYAQSPNTIGANQSPAYSVLTTSLQGAPVFAESVKLTTGDAGAANLNVPPENGLYDDFAAFTTLFTYWTFVNQDLGMTPGTVPGTNLTHPLTVVVLTKGSTGQSHYDAPAHQITLNPGNFDGDNMVVGHEYGHYVAGEAGMAAPLGAHEFLTNQRLVLTPNPTIAPSTTSNLTTADQDLSFTEGFGDWFAVSAAVHTPNVSALSDLPGFAAGELSSWRGRPLAQGSGGGEDTDASVTKILWALESDPKFAAVPGGKSSERQVFEAAVASGGTLYSLWRNITSGASVAALNRLDSVLAAQNVAPRLGTNNNQTVTTTAGEHSTSSCRSPTGPLSRPALLPSPSPRSRFTYTIPLGTKSSHWTSTFMLRTKSGRTQMGCKASALPRNLSAKRRRWTRRRTRTADSTKYRGPPPKTNGRRSLTGCKGRTDPAVGQSRGPPRSTTRTAPTAATQRPIQARGRRSRSQPQRRRARLQRYQPRQQHAGPGLQYHRAGRHPGRHAHLPHRHPLRLHKRNVRRPEHGADLQPHRRPGIGA